jgi:hypothetical protein
MESMRGIDPGCQTIAVLFWLIFCWVDAGILAALNIFGKSYKKLRKMVFVP